MVSSGVLCRYRHRTNMPYTCQSDVGCVREKVAVNSLDPIFGGSYMSGRLRVYLE